MLTPIYDINLSHPIQAGTVTVGCFDGIYPSLVGATIGNRIFVHSPVNRQEVPKVGGADISLLNIKQPINAVATGRLNPTTKSDSLFVGTSSSLLAYNVERNADLFYQQLPDGVKAITVGKFSGFKDPMVIAGGNCTIQGFDFNGTERMWTMTGDNVHSLAIYDFNSDGVAELAVGSEDFDIRLFQGDALITELSETDVVTQLCPLAGSRLAYALRNGIVGMYDGTERFWRIKAKTPAVSLTSFDANDDGVAELIIGWENGKVECRADSAPDGEPVFKTTLPSGIAGIVCADYRNNNDEQMMVASVDGLVRGFSRQSAASANKVNAFGAAVAASSEAALMSLANDQEEFRRLSSFKQRLLLELDSYSRNESIEKKVVAGEAAPPGDSIPASTQLLVRIYVDPGNLLLKSDAQIIAMRPGSGSSSVSGSQGFADNKPCVKLAAVVNTEAIEIRALAVFAEGVFAGGESEVLHPPSNRPLGTQLALPINPVRDTAAELHVKAIVGQRHASTFHVLETSIQLATFSSFVLHDPSCMAPVQEPRSHLAFSLLERIERVVIWVNQSFLLPQDFFYPGSGALHIVFLSIRNEGQPLVIHMETSGATAISTDDIDLAASVVASLASFLGVADLQVKAEFPIVETELSELAASIGEERELSEKLAGDVAENTEFVKLAVVRLEDARLLRDDMGLRRAVLDLDAANRSLVNQHRLRVDTHRKLVEHLRRLNHIIQTAASLRVGRFKNELIAACREAIKDNRLQTITKLIRVG